MVFGIDPGKSGAIVSLNKRGELDSAWPMPEKDMTLRGVLAAVISCNCPIFIERIPKYTGKAQSGSSVATLFSNYRYIVGYLDAHDADFTEVVPQVWMKPHRLATPDWQVLTYSKRKKCLHDIALEYFDVCKDVLPRWAADASLIALHGHGAGASKQNHE